MFWTACPSSYDCRAIPRRAIRVVMGSGLSVGFDCFPAYFVSPTALYPFARFPPRRPVPSHPFRSSACFILTAPSIASCSPHPLTGNALPPVVFSPYRLSPITPRLSCRRNGADFINASNSMPLQSGLRWRLLPVACLPSMTGSMLPVGSSHHLIEYVSLSHAYRRPIPSRCRLADGVVVPITPRFPPRSSCRRTGRECAWMSSDVMRSIP